MLLKTFFKLARFLLFFVLFSTSNTTWSQSSRSWQEIQKERKGEIIVHYYDNYPFVVTLPTGKIEGVEYDLMLAFVTFLQDSLGVNILPKFKRATTFQESYNQVKNATNKNEFGICSFSITASREREVAFSPAYMVDYELLITSKNIPTIQHKEVLNETLTKLKGLYVKGSTFEENMHALQAVVPKLQIEISPSNQDIRKRVEAEPNLFGYVELPAYLLDMKHGTKITRQKFYKMQRKGYGIILPLHSDWIEPLHFFFKSTFYKKTIDNILKKHFGEDVNETIHNIVNDATNSDLGKEVLLLNKEKEIQSLDLARKEAELKQHTFQRNLLFLGVLLSILSLGFLFYVYLSKQKHNRILAQANQQLQDLHHEKDQLLNIVAHDLRSPVNRIKGFMEILRITGEFTEEQQQYCHMIGKAIQESHQLIDDLLVIGRAEYENLALLLTEKIPLQPFLEELVAQQQAQAEQKQIQLHLEMPTQEIILPTEEASLVRILQNLLSNAIKFSPIQRNIWIRLSGEAGKITIAIQDEGQGFSPEDKTKVFQKFQKLSARPTAGESSTGLGLSIVKILTEKLGGTIHLESEWQKGSTFFITFPVL